LGPTNAVRERPGRLKLKPLNRSSGPKDLLNWEAEISDMGSVCGSGAR
jgi:hypothetical protein